MKKWTKALLATVCGVSMFAGVACGDKGGESIPEGYTKAETLNDKTTEQTYTEIMSVINDNKTNFTSTVDYNSTVIVSAQGQSMEMPLTIQCVNKVDGANLYEKDLIDMSQMGVNMDMTVWYLETTVDEETTGKAYLQSGNAKYQYTATWAQICETAGMDADDIFNPLYDFSDVSFDDVKFFVDDNTEDEEDVAPFFRLILKGDEAEEFANKRLGSMKDTMPDATMKYSDIEYRFVLNDDGAFDHAEIYFTVTMKATIENVKFTFEYDMKGTITLTDLGTTVVTAPANADSFTDLGDLGNAL